MSFECVKHGWRHLLNPCPSCNQSNALASNSCLGGIDGFTIIEFQRLKTENKELKDGWNNASANHLHLYEEIRELKSQLSTLTASNLEKEKEIERLNEKNSNLTDILIKTQWNGVALTQKLQSAIEVIEFYADRNNWKGDCGDDWVQEDSVTICGDTHQKYGGKRARSFLASLNPKSEGDKNE